MPESYKIPFAFHREFGVSEKDLERIAAYTENKNNPVILSKEFMKEVISERI